MSRFFVLGTDTDCGKTFVSSALCKALLRNGSRVVYCKPLETGDGILSDRDAVAAACAAPAALRVRGGKRYALAAAPCTAARAQNEAYCTAAEIAQIVRDAERDADSSVVEGCGGALTPLSPTEYVADVCPLLDDYSIVLVTGLRLGCLSHTFAVAEYLRRRWKAAPAIVLNDRFCQSADSYIDSTRDELALRGLSVEAYIAHGARLDEVRFKGVLEAAPA